MSKQFYLYPTLNEFHLDSAQIANSNLEFFYQDRRLEHLTGEIKSREIEYESSDQANIELNDKTGIWNASIDDLVIRQKLSIKNPSFLFSTDGIALPGSTIGVAVLWHSKQSLQRGSKKIGSFKLSDKSYSENIVLKFNKSELTGSLFYSVVLYIEEPAKNVHQFIFANESGLNIGTIFGSTITLEGEESSFPIVSIESKDKPLWSLYYSWVSLDDEFKDSITLRLNKLHSDYRILNMEEPKYYNEPLFKQILILVVTMIIDKARINNEIDIALDGDQFQTGTVGSLIKYYIETYEVDYESYDTIFESVMKGVWSNG